MSEKFNIDEALKALQSGPAARLKRYIVSWENTTKPKAVSRTRTICSSCCNWVSRIFQRSGQCPYQVGTWHYQSWLYFWRKVDVEL